MNRRVWIGALVCALVAGSLHGGVILSNLPGNDGGYSQWNSLSAVGGVASAKKAFGFTVGASNVDVTSATLRLNLVELTGLNSFSLELFNNSGSDPGASLAAFTNPSLSGSGIADWVFTMASPFQLSAGATYWLVFGANVTAPPGDIRWMSSDPNLTPTGPLATHVAGRLMDTGSSTWVPATRLNSFLLSGDAVSQGVPEPGTLATVAAGLAVVALRFRRRSAP